MGQAKNRGSYEDRVANAKTKKKVKARMVGAFYKENTDQGFGMHISNQTFDQEVVDLLCEAVEEAKPAYAEWLIDDHLTKEELAALLLEQIENDLCPTLNLFFYGTKLHPTTGLRTKEIDFFRKEDRDAFSLLSVFFMNVSWLTENGFLENDNFNGMLYAYEMSNEAA